MKGIAMFVDARTRFEGKPMSYWVAAPTMGSLQAILDEMEADGWNPDQHIQVNSVADSPAMHIVRPVGPDAGVSA